MPEADTKPEAGTKKLLGEFARQFPLAALLALALWGSFKGVWLWKSSSDVAVATVQGNLDRCEVEKTSLRDTLVQGIQFGQRRARESVEKIDSTSNTAKPDVKLSVKPKPVTDKEKSAALSPVTNTDAKSLATKQTAVQNLVVKTAPTDEAKVTKAKDKQ